MNPVARLGFTAVAVAVAVASFAARSANAQPNPVIVSAPIHIAWNSCYGTPDAANSLQYACDGSLDGNPRKLVVSFELPPAGPGAPSSYDYVYGTMATIEIRTLNSMPAPDYWRIQRAVDGGCRQPLTFAAVGAGVVDPDHCSSWLVQTTNNGPVALAYPAAPASDEVKVEGAMSDFANRYTIPAMLAGSKLSAGAFLIDPASGGCAGCEQEMIIELKSIDFSCTFPPNGVNTGYQLLPAPSSHSIVTWQLGPTPVRNRTWGAIKSLYR